jgi:hypothetical protein
VIDDGTRAATVAPAARVLWSNAPSACSAETYCWFQALERTAKHAPEAPWPDLDRHSCGGLVEGEVIQTARTHRARRFGKPPTNVSCATRRLSLFPWATRTGAPARRARTAAKAQRANWRYFGEAAGRRVSTWSTTCSTTLAGYSRQDSALRFARG